MYQLEFASRYSYQNERDEIAVPVVLKAGPKLVHLAASVDTGASFCIFRREVAEALNLDIESGTRIRFHTVAGAFEAFGHEVELSVLGVAIYSIVYFFADQSINKNVLGRVGWLDRIRLGIVHHDSVILLASYDRI